MGISAHGDSYKVGLCASCTIASSSSSTDRDRLGEIDTFRYTPSSKSYASDSACQLMQSVACCRETPTWLPLNKGGRNRHRWWAS